MNIRGLSEIWRQKEKHSLKAWYCHKCYPIVYKKNSTFEKWTKPLQTKFMKSAYVFTSNTYTYCSPVFFGDKSTPYFLLVLPTDIYQTPSTTCQANLASTIYMHFKFEIAGSIEYMWVHV